MRTTLNELPIFALCVWGGAAAGLAAALVRLPRRLYLASRKGRRAGRFPMLLFAAADVFSAALLAASFCAALIYANGGELRLYAVSGFLLGAALPFTAMKLLAGY